LSAQEQTLFTHLSVFAGGWTLEAAEAVCAGGAIVAADVVDLLLRLVDKSLVVAAESADGSTRYHLLETLRQYGRERLVAAGEAGDIHARHGHYYIALAEQAEGQLKGAEQVVWLERLDVEHENLSLAIQWLVENGDAEQVVPGLAALWFFWIVRGRSRQGRDLVGTVLSALGTEPTAARAWALLAAGWLAYFDADYVAAQALLEDAPALAQEVGAQHAVGLALLVLGGSARVGGDPHRAQKHLEDALAVFRAVGDRWGSAWALAWLVGPLLELGEVEAAHAACEEALAIRRALGDRHGLAANLGDLADVYRAQGKYGAARAVLEEALGIHRALGHHLNVPNRLRSLGIIALEQGDVEGARAFYTEALRTCQVAVARTQFVWMLAGLASLAAATTPLDALRLAGAVDALSASSGVGLPLAERVRVERCVAVARHAVEPDAAAAAWAEGRALSLEEAVTLALADTDAVLQRQ
jgi:tetratricopeptide (TPR) repeat protein